ncbi:hypothetical protein [Winogradskyella flava]|uniref:hypothetical protein n=1 Tax=Winogradskyella flava TaxID=1884876 RepID=UPI00248FECB5|nr:hypothetical protein [Winogradskyella flava]
MKPNHLFYNSNVDFKAISRKRFFLSVLLGLASAVLIYSFFYVLRETDRMMFLDFENRPVVIKEGDRQLFNLFFAAISIILGNSVAISFLFSRPQQAFSTRNNKRNRILNDQAFLGFNFIHWFAKVWFLFATFSSQFMGSKFITNFLWPSIFLIIVLYLDSWKSLSLVIKKYKLKVILIHLTTFLLLIFCLSRLNVIDYKSIDELSYKQRPTIEVPNSKFKDEKYERRYYNYLVFRMNSTSENQVGLFNEQNEPIKLYDVYAYINNWQDELVEELKPRATPRLRANKDVPIRYIKEFELLLFQYGQYKIIYEVGNDDESTKRFYNNQIKYSISPSLHEAFPREPHEPPRPPYFDYINELNSSDTIFVNVGKTVVFDNRIVKPNDLVTEFQKHIDSLTVFEYVYTDNTTYQDFINVLSAHKMAILELKMSNSKFDYEEMILEIHRNQFSRDEKLNAERDRLRKNFPQLITEKFE